MLAYHAENIVRGGVHLEFTERGCSNGPDGFRVVPVVESGGRLEARQGVEQARLHGRATKGAGGRTRRFGRFDEAPKIVVKAWIQRRPHCEGGRDRERHYRLSTHAHATVAQPPRAVELMQELRERARGCQIPNHARH